MKKTLFNQLLESVQQADEIVRGERQVTGRLDLHLAVIGTSRTHARYLPQVKFQPPAAGASVA